MVAALLLLLVIVVRYLDPYLITQARHAVYDNYQKLSPRVYESAPVRVVDIDEASLAHFGQWPWPRGLLGQLVDRLSQLGAAAIAFDIVFPEADRLAPRELLRSLDIRDQRLRDLVMELPDGDDLLAESIARSPVVLGIGASLAAVGYSGEPKAGFASAGANPLQLVQQYPGGVGNIPVLEEVATGQGSIAVGGNPGTVVRQVPLLQNIDGKLYPALTVEALRVAQGASTIVTRSSDASGEIQVGDVQSLQSMKVGGLEIPLTRDGQMWVHYTRDRPERVIPVLEIMTSDDIQSLVDRIQGHIILVGTSATGLKDIRATPFSQFEPGVLIHAQALEQMILQKFLKRPDWAEGVEILWLVGLTIVMIAALSTLGAIWSGILGVLATAGSFWVSWIAFTRENLLLDPVYPFVAALLIFIVTNLQGYARSERSRAFIKKAFSSYLSPALVEQLSDDPSRIRLEGESKVMTYLFTDIAGFTTMTEQTEATTLVTVLNEYLEGACQIVMDNGGTIDKLIGDAIVALYNAPLDQPDHAQLAVQTALALDRFCDEFSRRKQAEGIALGITRIGVHTGPAVVGNFGGSQRFDYTVIGDAVNIAARMESANKQLGTRICISESTVGLCRNLHFKPIGELVFVGKEEGVECFVPVSEEEARSEGYRRYTAIYDQLKRGEAVDLQVLEDLHQAHPQDPLIALHLARLRNGESGHRMVFSEK